MLFSYGPLNIELVVIEEDGVFITEMRFSIYGKNLSIVVSSDTIKPELTQVYFSDCPN